MFTNAIEWVQDTYELLKETWNDKGLTGNESDFDLKTHQYPSFTEKILPYQYFDEESKLFFNEYNAGLIYRIIPLTGANEHIAEQLDTLLQSKVSHEFTLQLICVKHNQVGNDIEAFTSQFAKSEFENLSLLGDNLKAFYQKAAIHGFKTNTMLSPRLTHTDCYIVIDKIKKESESDLKACFGQFRVSFEASLSAAKIGFKQADATDFLHLLHFYLDNCPDVITPRPVIYDKTKLLKEQALSHDFDIEFKNNEVVI
ncbi:TraC family protein, partial [Legionella pneumophila]